MEDLPTETDDTEPRERVAQLGIGACIGRYRITGRLGAGGMGEVFAAHDPQLDRQVAVKVLARHGERAMAQMIREARAVARLSHDNVIAVFDVGTHAGRVFLAMELVEGNTMRVWMRGNTTPLAERLRVLVAAGRGLQAAHDAGIVHGDFKPENVLVGRAPDGELRPRVIDFGLARETVQHGALSDPDATRDGDEHTDGLGTIAYMPPEQHRRGAIDARADQFAFCVCAWEVVYGARPFAGETTVAIVTAILDGRIEPPPRGAQVPARVRDALQRGLAVDPRARWPTMEALLGELGVGALRSRAVVAIVGLAAIAGLAALALRQPPPATACDHAQAPVHRVWSAQRRSEVSHAMFLTGDGDVPALVQRCVDSWVAEWAEAFGRVCPRVHDAGDDWVRSGDPAKLCLDRRLAELDAVVQVLPTIDTPDHGRVSSVLLGLGAIASCTDPDALASATAPGAPRNPEQIERFFLELARATAMWRMGKHEAGSAVLDAIEDELVAADWPPATIELDLARSRLPPDGETVEQAIARVEAAFARALASNADIVAAELALDLAWQFGTRTNEIDRAERWLARARTPSPGIRNTSMGIMTANLDAILHAKRGDGEGARLAFRTALDEALASDDESAMLALSANLARAEMSVGRSAEAFARIDEVRRHFDIEPGSIRDLDYAVLRACALRNSGDLTAAFAAYRALEEPVATATHSDEAAHVDLLEGLAITAYELGDVERSVALRRQLVAIYERGQETGNLAKHMVGLAEGMAAQAEVGPALDEAEALATRAMVISQADDVLVLGAAVRARAALRRGEPARAREHLAIARAHTRTTPDARLRRIDADLVQLEIADAERDPAALREAITALETSLPELVDRGRTAKILFMLARTRWLADFDRPRAREIAEQADAWITERGGDPRVHQEIRAWLAEHR